MREVFAYMIGLGAAVMMPIIFTALGVCIGIKPARALKSGLLVGVGFVGLGVVTALLTSSLGPALKGMTKLYHLNLPFFDLGWPAAAVGRLLDRIPGFGKFGIDMVGNGRDFCLDYFCPYLTGGTVVGGVMVNPKEPTVEEAGASSTGYVRTYRTMDTSKPWAELVALNRSSIAQNVQSEAFCCRLVCPATIPFKPVEQPTSRKENET